MSDFTIFLHDVRYIVLFYVIGDIATTYYSISLDLGYEANPLLASSPILLILFLKLGYLVLLNLFYVKFQSKHAWNAVRYSVGLMGVFIFTNNLYVIHHGISFLQVAGVI